MTNSQRLASILRTTPLNAVKRARLMKLTPACGRCGGSGQYSYCAQYGTTCFGCRGVGHVEPSTAAEWALTISAATAAAEDGNLDRYIETVKARGAAKRASKEFFAAWKDADTIILYGKNWTHCAEPWMAERTRLNNRISRAWDRAKDKVASAPYDDAAARWVGRNMPRIMRLIAATKDRAATLPRIESAP